MSYKDTAEANFTIFDAFTKAESVLDHHKDVMVSISGGADSDVMVDLLHRVAEGRDVRMTYVWFDTGIEYEATKKHLVQLEEKYGIEIVRQRALKSIPTCCREYGQPFLSKFVSEHIGRLQRHGFKWEDRPFAELYEEYPRCKSSLRWWTNDYRGDFDRPSHFDIGRNKWLKEFMLENPPTFPISSECCTYAKKKVAKRYIKENGFDLNCVGIRKAEGGIRSTVYTSCYDSANSKYGLDVYRPLFWFDGEDRATYERLFGVEHSECYRSYGFKRTGCAGCPYNRNLEEDLRISRLFEPKLYEACTHVFADSYEYTRRYREFYAAKQREAKA